MSATEFDRQLAKALEETGPSIAPVIVDAALAQARAVRQRKPMFSFFDRHAWPSSLLSLGNPTTARLALVMLVVLLAVALLAAAIGIGSQLLRQPSPLTVWAPTGAMSEARDDGATLTLLADGRVLATGGGTNGSPVSIAEVYDPSSGTWTRVGDMVAPRRYAAATRLPDGKVLVSGGGNFGDSGTAELFDPITEAWTSTGDMVEVRGQHASILLPSGEVLVAGGTPGTTPSLEAELYDPASRTWRAAGAMTTWRASPAITLLRDGTVLVTGGYGSGPVMNTAEVYDPDTELWTSTANNMDQERKDDHTATLLPDGMVLMAGGALDETTMVTAVELYHPATRSWTAAPWLVEARGGAKAVLLRDGSVLIVGGVGDGGGALASVVRFGASR